MASIGIPVERPHIIWIILCEDVICKMLGWVGKELNSACITG